MVHHAIAQAEDHPLVLLDQQARRLRISSPERLDQRGVVHRHLAAAPTRPSGRCRQVGLYLLPQARRFGFNICWKRYTEAHLAYQEFNWADNHDEFPAGEKSAKTFGSLWRVSI